MGLEILNVGCSEYEEKWNSESPEIQKIENSEVWYIGHLEF